MMALERTASNIGEKPRSPALIVPSRTSSLRTSCAGPLGEKDQIVASVRSAYAKTVGETLTESRGANSTVSRRQSLIDNASNLEFLNTDPTVGVPRNSSTRNSLGAPRINYKAASCNTVTEDPMRGAKVHRWAGLTRTTSDWDGLRRDPELWLEDGDCLIHLYARGQSRRGPSFCVPFKTLKQRKCGSMFSLCFAQMTATPGVNAQNPRRVSSGLSTPVPGSNKVELFVPAPDEASREAAFKWHLTTRNFFAFVYGKPLVGNHMGQALVDLQERMHLFRSGQINNHKDFLDYVEEQGYRDFVDCPDYALSMLYYAEHYKLRDIWIDAFAHCVGMNESLSLSQEFAPLSRLTKALITRAYLEMDIQLGRVTLAVRNFLEDDLSPAYLGLTDGARAHLDRFRSFLHSFYVEKFGYWPPPKGSAFSKALFRSLYFDFKNIYDYLVDVESTADLSSQKPASGGICVLQNVDSFDKRHKFPSLPHPLPLIPNEVPQRRRTESQKSLRALSLGSKQAKTDRYLTARAALTAATNSNNVSASNSPAVQAYVRFERQCALNNKEEKVSLADARKVRWLLIYSTLQYLVSALRAPKEVRDTESPDYPLCCLVTEQSPWQAGTKVLTSPVTHSVNIPDAINTYLSQSKGLNLEASSPLGSTASTIQPDCQTDDYFSHTNRDTSGRPVSVEVPAPLKISQPTAQPVRNLSVRSFKRLSFSTLSSRRNSVQRKQPAHSEIMVYGYGNGLNNTTVDPPSYATSQVPSRAASQVPSRAPSQPSSQAPSQAPSRRQSVSIKNGERTSGSTLPEGAGPDTSWLRPSTPDLSSQGRQLPNLELDTTIVPDPIRTPVIDSFRMEDLVSPITSEAPQKFPSSSNSTASMDSPFWSDEASAASSKSSTHDEPLDRKASPAEESGLLGGLVSIEKTPIASPHKTPKSSQPTSPATSNRRGEFCFSFDQQTSSFMESVEDILAPLGADSAIGVALSTPLPPSQYATPAPPTPSMSSDNIALADRPSPSSRSASTNAVPLFKFTSGGNGLRMHPPSVSKKGTTKGIFSALTMAPKTQVTPPEPVSHRSGYATPQSVSDAIPSPIAKSPKIPKAKGTKNVEEEEISKKKDRRKSFWRR